MGDSLGGAGLWAHNFSECSQEALPWPILMQACCFLFCLQSDHLIMFKN